MATVYMEIIPPVLEGGGSVTAEGYPGWMELSSLSSTVERAIKQSAETATNREAAHPQIQAISCSRMADVATPGMFQWSVLGKPRKVKIHLCMPGEKGKPIPYTKYELDNCILSKFVLKDDAEGAPSEDFELSFSKIAFEFQVYDELGGATEGPKRCAYDLVLNKLL